MRIVKVFGAILLFLVLFVWGLARDANAGELRIGLGIGASHDNHWKQQSIMLSDRDWYLDVSRLGGDDLLPDTWRYAFGYRVDWREHARVAPYLRMGVAYFEKEPYPLISEQLTYDMAAGVRLWKVLDVEWGHNSTAGRSRRNWGNDIFSLNLVFGF